jgi:hypothetical protein
MERVKRREERPRFIDSLRPLPFRSDATDLDVSTLHVFPEADAIVLSFVTTQRTVNLKVPPRLARRLGDGVRRLTWRLSLLT